VYCTLTEVFINLTEVFLTLTESFPCFFLSCKANARVKLAKTGHGPHSSTLFVIWLLGYFCCSLYCLCVNVYCQRVTTQLQLINISYIIRRCCLTSFKQTTIFSLILLNPRFLNTALLHQHFRYLYRVPYICIKAIRDVPTFLSIRQYSFSSSSIYILNPCPLYLCHIKRRHLCILSNL
jgi:hypothetical protein